MSLSVVAQTNTIPNYGFENQSAVNNLPKMDILAKN